MTKTDRLKKLPIKGTNLGDLLTAVMQVKPPKAKKKARKKKK